MKFTKKILDEVYYINYIKPQLELVYYCKIAKAKKTEFIDEYRAKFGRRATTTGNIRRNNISYNSGSEDIPGTSKGLRTKSAGFSDYSSETALQYSAQFGRRAKLKPEKIQKFIMRSNLRSPGPEVKFEGSSEQKDNFTQKPILKMEKIN